MATTYKKGELQDHEGKQLLPRTKAALVETEDGSNVEEKLGAFLPFSGGTMTGPAVGAPGAIATPQFRNVQYGTEPLTPGESPLPQGTLYITPEARGEAGDWKQVVDNNHYTLKVNESAGLALLIIKPFTVSSKIEVYVSNYFSGISYAACTYELVNPRDPDCIPPEYRSVGNAYFRPQTLFINPIQVGSEWYLMGYDIGVVRMNGGVSISFRGLYSGNSKFEIDMPSYIQTGGDYIIYPYSPYMEQM